MVFSCNCHCLGLIATSLFGTCNAFLYFDLQINLGPNAKSCISLGRYESFLCNVQLFDLGSDNTNGNFFFLFPFFQRLSMVGFLFLAVLSPVFPWVVSWGSFFSLLLVTWATSSQEAFRQYSKPFASALQVI